jgi:hypothetical protein
MNSNLIYGCVAIIIILAVLLIYYHERDHQSAPPSGNSSQSSTRSNSPSPSETIKSATFKFTGLIPNYLTLTTQGTQLATYTYVAPGLFVDPAKNFGFIILKIDLSAYNLNLDNYKSGDTGTVAYFAYFTLVELSNGGYIIDPYSVSPLLPAYNFNLNYGILRLDYLLAGTDQLVNYMDILGFEDLTSSATSIFTYKGQTVGSKIILQKVGEEGAMDITLLANPLPVVTQFPTDPLYSLSLDTTTSSYLFNKRNQ